MRQHIEEVLRGTKRVHELELITLSKRAPFGTRRISVMSPEDTLLFLTLAVLAAPHIEMHRLPASARQIFSYRFSAADGSLFDPAFSYGTFLDEGDRRLQANAGGLAAIADIESFYERITPPQLERALARCRVDGLVRDSIADLIGYWNEATYGSGLPIGSNASRILAEAVLVSVDAALVRAGVQFVRFVDDYRLFVPTIEAGQAALGLLADALEAIGLSLNPHKTGLSSVEELRSGQSRGFEPLLADDKPNPVPPRPDPRPTRPPGEKRPRGPRPDPFSPRKYDTSAPALYEPPADLHEQLRSVGLDELRSRLSASVNLPSSPVVHRFIAGALETENAAAIASLPGIIFRLPHFAGFCVSGILHWAQHISGGVRTDLAADFAAWLAPGSTVRDHLKIEAIRLLGSPYFARPEVLGTFVADSTARGADFLARIAIDALRQVGGRKDLNDLIRRFASLGPWSKRSVIVWASALGSLDSRLVAGAAATDVFDKALLAAKGVIVA
jgi:hypothetical protein